MKLDMKEIKASNGANLGFEEKMWKAADKLRNNMDAERNNVHSEQSFWRKQS